LDRGTGENLDLSAELTSPLRMGANWPPATLPDAAEWYANKLGWPVFPLAKGDKVPLRGSHGFKEATTDLSAVQRQWSAQPECNIGIALPKGLMLLDVDTGEAFQWLKSEGLYLPPTATQRTPRGGWHFLYGTGANSVRQTVGELFPGIDTKAGGKGYFVAAPSRVNEESYTWESLPSEIEAAPEWLAERFQKPPRSRKAPLDVAAILNGVPEGKRDETLFLLACKLRGTDFSRESAERLCLEAAAKCSPPFSQVDALAKVESAYKYPPGAAPTGENWTQEKTILGSLVYLVSRKGLEEALGAFLKRAAKKSREEVIAYSDLPRTQRNYRSPSFVFARCLLTRHEFTVPRQLNSKEAPARIDEEVESMFPGQSMPWAGALGLSEVDSCGAASDPRTDFQSLWKSTKKPYHLGGRIGEAAAQAREHPYDLGEGYSHPRDSNFREVISLCFCLRDCYSGKFSLSCRQVEEVSGISHGTAAKLLSRGVEEKFLAHEGTYSEDDAKKRKAREYRFIADEPGGIQGATFGAGSLAPRHTPIAS
jgi:hypothetical protein